MATEEPPYQVHRKDGAFEVRDYPALVVAEVTVGGERDEAANAGFRLLAGYIFGGNTRQQSIAMTAPVVQAPTAQAPAAGESIAMTAPVIQTAGMSGAWIVRFVMPRAYTLETLPTPNDPRVRLTPTAPVRVAVVRFSGLARPRQVAEQTAALEAFLAAQGFSAAGPPSLARYNPPWTLWFLRRNEVWIPLSPSPGG